MWLYIHINREEVYTHAYTCIQICVYVYLYICVYMHVCTRFTLTQIWHRWLSRSSRSFSSWREPLVSKNFSTTACKFPTDCPFQATSLRRDCMVAMVDPDVAAMAANPDVAEATAMCSNPDAVVISQYRLASWWQVIWMSRYTCLKQKGASWWVC